MLSKHRITDLKYDCIIARINKGSIDYESDPLYKRKHIKSNLQDDQGLVAPSDGLRKMAVKALSLQKVVFFQKFIM